MSEGLPAWLTALAPIILALPFFVGWARSYPAFERKLVVWVAAAHAMGAVAIVVVTRDVYGYGDMLKYHRTGVLIGDYVRSDGTLLSEVFGLIFHRESTFDFVDGAGTATGTVHGLSALLALPLFDSLPAMCMVIALGSASAKLALYAVFRRAVHPARRTQLGVTLMLIPSSVFWSCGLLKEGFAVVGFGWLIWALAPLVGLTGRSWSVPRTLLAVPAGALVALTKAYLLFPFALAAAASWYVARGQRGKRVVGLSPLRLALAVALAVGLLMALSSLFPKYAADNVVEQASTLRELEATHRGGSTFEVGHPVGGGIVAHLAYAPVALGNVLFRPLLIEARSALMVMSALEMTAFLVLVVMAIRRNGVRGTIQRMLSEPVLAFCCTYVVVFGTAVGLAITNMGSLDRYRSPMLPFLGLLVFGLLRPPSVPQPVQRSRLQRSLRR